MLEKTVKIPEGVEVSVEKNSLAVKGPKGELERKIPFEIKLDKKDSEITVRTEKERRKLKALAGTWRAHIENMVIGVSKGWEAKLKIVYSHFPMKFSVKEDNVIIENFLGERKSRTANIIPGAEVKNEKDVVIVSGIDKEIVGQTAANIETAAKVKGFDRRVFQDGIYITEKACPIE